MNGGANTDGNSLISSRRPSSRDIVKMANAHGFKERRPEVSKTLYFEEMNPPPDMKPVLIHVYYTTCSIMTSIDHPSSGKNKLWRSNAYETLDELRSFFLNPRKHTGKGYRRKEDAVRGCIQCGTFKKRGEFSKNQWSGGPYFNRCKNCAQSNGDMIEGLSNNLEGMTLNRDLGESLPLTSDLLEAHNQIHENRNQTRDLERRQFNCPECPKHGRGKFIFFKKVPTFKPLVKCPQCKKVTHGKCKRIHPISKSAEKGYGHFMCRLCRETWGSSRAVANIGQQCLVCLSHNRETYVKPFRLEVLKKKPKSKVGREGGFGGGREGGFEGGRGRIRRISRVAPIKEDQETRIKYHDDDIRRNDQGGNNALLNSNPFRYEYDDSSSTSSPLTNPKPENRLKLAYEHKCEGCASGVCRSRYLPESIQHDQSDGDTVSTSLSIVTNSIIDKTDYADRDEDFDQFEDDNESWTLVT